MTKSFQQDIDYVVPRVNFGVADGDPAEALFTTANFPGASANDLFLVVHSWTFGIQREIFRDTVVEARYVGTRGKDLWRRYNLNEINVVENNFLREFRLAQGNLAANLAAGLGNTFAFTGIPGTSPLPSMLAFFNGIPTALAGNPAL